MPTGAIGASYASAVVYGRETRTGTVEPARRRQRLNAGYVVAQAIVRPVMFLFTRKVWTGWEHLPREGGFVASPNHLSNFDPFPVSWYLFHSGCVPFFLGKESLFRLPLVGRLLHAAGQVPVYRRSSKAGDAYRAAVQGVRDGKCIVVFPEGTLTRDPQLWPMVGKSGAARIALETRCPLVPMAHWGSQDVIPHYGRGLHLLPRKTLRVTAGAPVDLSDLYGRAVDAATLREATERLMAAVADLVGGLRNETPPTRLWDPREHGQSDTGNYLKEQE
ncbi:lysophospholipid acyltransferase family protein [Dermatophilaceae bacterium Soc4.6]